MNPKANRIKGKLNRRASWEDFKFYGFGAGGGI